MVMPVTLWMSLCASTLWFSLFQFIPYSHSIFYLDFVIWLFYWNVPSLDFVHDQQCCALLQELLKLLILFSLFLWIENLWKANANANTFDGKCDTSNLELVVGKICIFNKVSSHVLQCLISHTRECELSCIDSITLMVNDSMGSSMYWGDLWFPHIKNMVL